MNKNLLASFFLTLAATLTSNSLYSRYDVTLVGYLNFADGIGRSPVTFIDMLKNELTVNFISSRKRMRLSGISPTVASLIKNPDKTPGAISLLLDAAWYKWMSPYIHVPQSTIRLAYSMVEMTAIPKQWVKIFNKHFDAVVVPDPFLVQIYESSGVKKPIFVLPSPLYLDEFLSLPLKQEAQKPFVFGMSGVLCSRKNQELLITAFAQEFGNNPDVKLKLHARHANPSTAISTQEQLARLHVNNIELIIKPYTQQQYIQFMQTIDCYVLLSRGEGFSNTPREALAMGIPCILSCNTGHTTICNANLAYGIESSIKEPADYRKYFGTYCGYYFNCKVDDVKTALREVYTNYQTYIERGPQAREWARQYTHANLKAKYVTLFKPKKVMLGNKNSIEDDCLITKSQELYQKYVALSSHVQ